MNAKDILAKVKAMFDLPIAPAPVAPLIAATAYKLKDGTEISITLTGSAIAVGDMVTVAGAPAPAGDYELEDGSVLTVDATGAITAIVELAPITQPDFKDTTTKPPATIEDRIKAIESRLGNPLTMAAIEGTNGLTTEAISAMYSKFATGTPEERLANLEVMIKALMECNFGYQIRQGQESTAIQVYKDSLAPIQTTMEAHTTKLQEAEAKIKKQDEIITGLFELAEKLTEQPTADPKTLNGNKKDIFERMSKRDQFLTKMGDSIREMKKSGKILQ